MIRAAIDGEAFARLTAKAKALAEARAARRRAAAARWRRAGLLWPLFTKG